MKRSLTSFTAAAVLALASAAGAQQAPSVSPLVVTPQPMAPVPQVGEGAPLYSAPEIKVMQDAARETEQQARSDVLRCTGNVREAIPARRGLMTKAEIDAIGAAAAKNGGLILLEPIYWGGGGSESLREAYAAESGAAQMIANLSIEAQEATLAAEAARRRAVASPSPTQEMIETELARQKAVNRMNTARAVLLELQEQTKAVQQAVLAAKSGGAAFPPQAFDRIDRRYQNGQRQITVPDEYKDLQVDEVKVTESTERSGRVLQVSGRIMNTRDSTPHRPAALLHPARPGRIAPEDRSRRGQARDPHSGQGGGRLRLQAQRRAAKRRAGDRHLRLQPLRLLASARQPDRLAHGRQRLRQLGSVR